MIRKFETSADLSPPGFTQGAADAVPVDAHKRTHKRVPEQVSQGSSGDDDLTGPLKKADQEHDIADPQGIVTTLVVSPNLSMSWRANLLLVAAIAFVCFGSALVWAYLGFWMVLPFAGLEVLFVTVCLYLTVRKLSIKEVITIGSEEIKLEWGMYEPQRSVTLPRHWSRLHYQCDDNPFEVGSLSVGAHGKHYVLGQSLGKDEKHTLYRELHQLL